MDQTKENLKVFNKQLDKKDWITGSAAPTLADYQLALATMELHQCIMDQNSLKSLNHLSKHFKRVTELPDFKARMGTVKVGKKQLLPYKEEDKVAKQINAKAAKKKK